MNLKINIKLLCILLNCILFGAASAANAKCNSGPDFCTDDPRIPAALAKKKQRLAAEYPERLVSLLNKGIQCIARIERSPDGFSLLEVEKDGYSIAYNWTANDETKAKQRLSTGQISRYWIMHSRRAFSCDGETAYNQRPDYDKIDDINASLAIKCLPNSSC